MYLWFTRSSGICGEYNTRDLGWLLVCLLTALWVGNALSHAVSHCGSCSQLTPLRIPTPALHSAALFAIQSQKFLFWVNCPPLLLFKQPKETVKEKIELAGPSSGFVIFYGHH
jgi:hypothetical protein